VEEGDGYPSKESKHLDVIVERLHYTASFRDFRIFHEDYRYIFSNWSGHPYLPLLWRDQGVQANMVTVDAEDTNLVFLPSGRGIQLTLATLREKWYAFLSSIPASDRDRVAGSVRRDNRSSEFERSAVELRDVLSVLDELKARYGGTLELEDLDHFARQLNEFYIPYVSSSGLKRSEFLYIHQGVDVLTRHTSRIQGKSGGPGDPYTWGDALSFLALGRIDVDVSLPLVAFTAPPWAHTLSLHVRTVVPDGFEIVDPPSGLPEGAFEGTSIIGEARWDARTAYVYVGEDDAERVVENCQRMVSEFEDVKREFDSQGTQIQLGKGTIRDVAAFIGTARDYIRRSSPATLAKDPSLRVRAQTAVGIRLLTGLLWIVVGLGFYLGLTHNLGATDFIELFSALLIVVLSLVVYAVEKPILRWYVLAQTATWSAVLLEIYALAALRPLYGGLLGH